jgi:hypothetical protein
MNGSNTWLPMAAPSPCWRTSGELYYEVEVCEAVGHVLVGFAGANIQADRIGEGDNSWAIYDWGIALHR